MVLSTLYCNNNSVKLINNRPGITTASALASHRPSHRRRTQQKAARTPRAVRLQRPQLAVAEWGESKQVNQVNETAPAAGKNWCLIKRKCVWLGARTKTPEKKRKLTSDRFLISPPQHRAEDERPHCDCLIGGGSAWKWKWNGDGCRPLCYCVVVLFCVVLSFVLRPE